MPAVLESYTRVDKPPQDAPFSFTRAVRSVPCSAEEAIDTSILRKVSSFENLKCRIICLHNRHWSSREQVDEATERIIACARKIEAQREQYGGPEYPNFLQKIPLDVRSQARLQKGHVCCELGAAAALLFILGGPAQQLRAHAFGICSRHEICAVFSYASAQMQPRA